MGSKLRLTGHVVRLRAHPEWLVLWSVFAGFFLLHGVLFGAFSAVATFLLQALAGALLSLFSISARPLVVALFIVLVGFLILAGVVQWGSSRTWQSNNAEPLSSVFTKLLSRSISSSGQRAWEVADGTKALKVSFDARLLSGTAGWDWVRSDPDIRLNRLLAHDGSFTRVTMPSARTPFILKFVDTGAPIAGRTFRAAVELRSHDPGSAGGSLELWLQEGGGNYYAKRLPVSLKPEWNRFEFSWTTPKAASSRGIRLVIHGSPETAFDVRHAELSVFEDPTWQKLGPLVPDGFALLFEWAGKSPNAQSQFSFLPDNDWESISFHIRDDSLADAETIRSVLRVGEGLTIGIRQFSITASDSNAQDPTPLPFWSRQQLWFSQPNLAGHTVTTLALTLAMLSRGLPANLALLAGAFSIFLTGSRAAFLGAAIGFPWLALLANGPRFRRRTALVLGLCVVALLALLITGNMGRLQVVGIDSGTPRVSVWRSALVAFLSNPWTGVAPMDFATFWGEHWDGRTEEVVSHAHNLWLQLAASHGLLGLFSILWLTGGLTAIAWRWARARGLALVISILAMNSFDYTLFYSGVLFPLVLGLNSQRRRALRTERALAVGIDSNL
jgi:hypothetical protein